MKKLSLLLLTCFALGCAASYRHYPTGEFEYHQSLGVADIHDCTEKLDEKGQVVERRCLVTHTDAFSGWKAIMEGISSGIVKILTLGLVNI